MASIDDLKEYTVLYVEDEVGIRENTSRVLTNFSKKLIIAQNGQEGLDLYGESNGNVDLIITDINMPKLDGLSMCYKIRETNDKVPIVITSGHSNTNYFKQAEELKVLKYFSKPVDLSDLIHTLLKML